MSITTDDSIADEALSSLDAEILSLALCADSTSPVPISPTPWPISSTTKESLIYHIQKQSGELKDISIPNMVKKGLIILEDAKDTEKKWAPTLYYRITSSENAQKALNDFKSLHQDVSEDSMLAKAIENVAAMIPSVYYEENYWWWTKSLLKHAFKLVDCVLERKSTVESAQDAIFTSDSFGYLIVFVLWYHFYLSNTKLYEHYLQECKRWIAIKPEDNPAAMVVRCRTLLIQARVDSAETQRLETVLSYCNEAQTIQESHKDIFHIKARTQALITTSSVHRYLGNYGVAEESIQHAFEMAGFPNFMNNPDHEVPRDPAVALCLAQILSSAATLHLAQDQEKLGEELCTRAFKIQASFLGRDHISTLATVLKLTEARTVSRENLDTVEDLLTESIAVSKRLYPETDLAACFLLQQSDYHMASGNAVESVRSADAGYKQRLDVMGELEPESLDALKQLAVVQRAARMFDEALRNHMLLERNSIKQFGPDAPRTVVAKVEVALSLGSMERMDEAIQKSEEALASIARNTENIPIWLQKKTFGVAAMLYRSTGDFAQSRRCNLERLALCEKHADVWETTNATFDVAITYEIEGNLAEAKRYYEKLGDITHNIMVSDPAKASRMSQLFAEAYLGCVRILIHEGFTWNALTMLQQAWNTCQEYFPDNKQFLGRWHESRGAIFESTGDYDQAKEQAELALKYLSEDEATDPTFLVALKEQIDKYGEEARKKKDPARSSTKPPASSSGRAQRVQNTRRRKQKSDTGSTVLFASAIAASVALVTISAVLFYRALKK